MRHNGNQRSIIDVYLLFYYKIKFKFLCSFSIIERFYFVSYQCCTFKSVLKQSDKKIYAFTSSILFLSIFSDPEYISEFSNCIPYF